MFSHKHFTLTTNEVFIVKDDMISLCIVITNPKEGVLLARLPYYRYNVSCKRLMRSSI